MNLAPCSIADVKVITPRVFADNRGYFFESFNHAAFEKALGRSVNFVQDNQSMSTRHVLRGLHYQIQQSQGKLVRALSGEIFDVAVDLRKSSPTFGKWCGEILSAENKKQLWIPEGFAHGFVALSDTVEVLYKTTDYWAPQHERTLLWNDPAIGIEWNVPTPVLSKKDKLGLALAQAETFA